MRILSLAVTLAMVSGLAHADKRKPRYHFALAEVTIKAEVPPELGEVVRAQVQAQASKALAAHPQLVATLDGAPTGAKAHVFARFLAKKKLAGAFRVFVEVVEASEITEDDPRKPGELRLVTTLAIHVFGETLAERTFGFTGDGGATVKLEVGKKVRPNDRRYAWDNAAELALTEAISTSLLELAKPRPVKKPTKKP